MDLFLFFPTMFLVCVKIPNSLMFLYVLIAKLNNLNEFALQVVHICLMLGEGLYDLQFISSLFLQEHEILPFTSLPSHHSIFKAYFFFPFLTFFPSPKLLILETALSHHIYQQIPFLLVLVSVIGHILKYLRFIAPLFSLVVFLYLLLVTYSLLLFILVCFPYHKLLRQNRDEKERERDFFILFIFFYQDLVVFGFSFYSCFRI